MKCIKRDHWDFVYAFINFRMNTVQNVVLHMIMQRKMIELNDSTHLMYYVVSYIIDESLLIKSTLLIIPLYTYTSVFLPFY